RVARVLGRARARARRTRLASGAGNVAGVQIVAVSVALGVGTLVQRSDVVFTMVKLAGAGYLVWLGGKAIRPRRSLADAMVVTAAPRSGWEGAGGGVPGGVVDPHAETPVSGVCAHVSQHAAGARAVPT